MTSTMKRFVFSIVLVLVSASIWAQVDDKSFMNPQSADKNGFFNSVNENTQEFLDLRVERDNLMEEGEEIKEGEEGEELTEEEEQKLKQDSLKNVLKPKDSNLIFGQQFLSNMELEYSNDMSLVPPPNYRIGPGDMIAINIWDGTEEQQTYTVDKDGSIFPAYLGKIYVQGLTFENLQSLLKSRFYNIVSGNSKIDVQLVKVRSVRVNVVGEVNKPNGYTISSFETVLNVLAKAGGVTDRGSMRNIEIKRNGYTVYTFDLYEFMTEGGNIDADLYLENNDYVVVPIHRKTVKAQGMFRRPMYYQLREEENLQKLLELTGGLMSSARKSNADIFRFKMEAKELISLNIGNYIDDPNVDFILQDLDVIEVDSFSGMPQNVVSVMGAVKFPGIYEVLPGENLSQMIHKAGGLRKDAYLKRAIIRRGDSLNPMNTMNVNLEELTLSSERNIPLEFGDRITIFSNLDFYQQRFLKILGAVKNPGEYEYFGTISIKDLILLAGGLTEEAEYSQLEVSRVYDTIGPLGFVRTKPNVIYNIAIDGNLEQDVNTEKFILKPFDIVIVKKNQRYKLQDVVYIEGEVEYPGHYTLNDDIYSLSQLIEAAGGITNRAMLENSTFIRDTLGSFYCDFVKAYNRPNSSWDLHLTDGDTIYIARDDYYVKVMGEVEAPISTFVNPTFTSLSDYINLAGGYTDEADSKRVFVRYNDGKSARPKRFWFYTFYPSLENGGDIVVPTRDPENDFDKVLARALDNSYNSILRLSTALGTITSSIASAILIYLSINGE